MSAPRGNCHPRGGGRRVGGTLAVAASSITSNVADEKGGGVDHGPRIFAQPTCHHVPDVYGGIGESRASALLRDFFAVRRS